MDVFIARDGARAVNDALMCLSKMFFVVVAVDVLWVVGKRIESGEYIACLS